MPPTPPTSPLGGLSPADLLKQAAAEDTLADEKRSAFIPPSTEVLAAAFPSLEILSLIGQGGMGAVYRVRQPELDRTVALKILPPVLAEDPTFADRFTREAKALAKLSHPGIVTLHEFGRSGGYFFILMEHVDGVNLRQLLEQGRISPREALAIVPQVCDALQFAHDHGIVHRDIKPENLLIDRRGRVKVADFGLAKLAAGLEPTADGPGNPGETMAGHVLGTPRYMAPEQVERPGEVDHRADIYALGVVLYQMLTGELPGERLEPPSRKVRIDVRLDEIVLQALERNPELRFQQASVMKTRVEEAGGPAAPAGRPALSRAARLFALPLQWIALALLVFGLAGIFGDPPRGQWLQGKFQAATMDTTGIGETMAAIARDSGTGATVSRHRDGREWLVSVHHDDPATASENYQRVQSAVMDHLKDRVAATETSSASAGVWGAFSRFRAGYLLAGGWIGLAGGLLLLAVQPQERGKLAGKIALTLLGLSILGKGFLPVTSVIAQLWIWLGPLLGALVFALAGLRSRPGQLALFGFWIMAFQWINSVPWKQMAFPPRPGLGWSEVTATAMAPPVARADTPAPTPAADPADITQAWLELLDRAAWAEAFAALAPRTAGLVTADQWNTVVTATREPLGRTVSRTLRPEPQALTNPPGMPAGDFLIFRADTAFEKRTDSVETVILMKTGDSWKPAGYYIR